MLPCSAVCANLHGAHEDGHRYPFTQLITYQLEVAGKFWVGIASSPLPAAATELGDEATALEFGDLNELSNFPTTGRFFLNPSHPS